MQRAVETVHVDRSVGLYMVDLVTATRGHGQVQVGASPRGTLALLKLARCRAVLDGRDFVSPDDVKAIAVPGPRPPPDAAARDVDPADQR